MCKKFRRRLWFLRNLSKAIRSKDELVSCYSCFLRPVLEYLSNVYHPMLNARLTKHLEGLQIAALRIIYGYAETRETILRESGLDTLESRRETLFKKICLKTHSNPRFRDSWLKDRNFTGPDLRHQKIFNEYFARTDRLFKSPIYTLRRTLNDILIT